MKKFSKLFSRRLGRGATEKDYSRHLVRETSPDVHQLSRRRTGLPANARTAPRSGLSLIIVDESHQPCDTCRAIDFPRLLDWQPGQPRPWIELSHTLADSECPFCTFFQALIGAVDGTDTFTPYLRIRLAFERLGVSEKHPIGKSVLIEVSTKTKSLPWGYIVRAAEPDAPGTQDHDSHDPGIDQSNTELGGEDDDDSHAKLNGHANKGSDQEPPLIRGRTISPFIDPALARSWFEYCQANHSDDPCSRKPSAAVGIRLIDCDKRSVITSDSLDQSEDIDYLALSYPRPEMNVQSADDWSCLPDDLPPLFADAISATRALGFRYLWIDQFCMPNPVSEPEEHRRQNERIGDIFQRANMTLVIAAGDSVDDGIPGVSVPREEQLSLKTETGTFTTSLLRPDLDIGGSKWAATGLSYQEGVFSRRRLVFTPLQTYFQCNTFHCHESISIPLQYTGDLNLGRAFPASVPMQPGSFKTHIAQYMYKDYATESDRLEAFKGVLHRYSQLDVPVESILGLPLFHADEIKGQKLASQTDRLAIALGWMPDNGMTSEGYASPFEYQDTCPSWTWLSWRPRLNHNPNNNGFHFSLVEELPPIITDVCASPRMEIRVGFDDESVLPWEAESQAVLEAADHITFLRIKTLSFTMQLQKSSGVMSLVDSPFNKNTTTLIEAWCQSTKAENIPDGTHELPTLLISSRQRNGEAKGTATFIVSRRKDWHINDKLVRLGVLRATFQELTITDEENGGNGTAYMKGLESEGLEEEKPPPRY
ncbi:hypothetical protein B0I35DRAFT_409391 [Stachybotrys elegans]|uniref:Heterokaryon incompatibility domain-containing protein n=1 Tax=Stachybotrys elegans TaxID=80388 RepID=A0A8K0WR88_9HYPO|nr:hypothetical protein B0I35DRAFT_409391 [Stachybotrys elegans]